MLQHARSRTCCGVTRRRRVAGLGSDGFFFFQFFSFFSYQFFVAGLLKCRLVPLAKRGKRQATRKKNLGQDRKKEKDRENRPGQDRDRPGQGQVEERIGQDRENRTGKGTRG